MSQRTSARYDEIADFYDSVVGDAVADPATSGLLSLVGEVRDMRLLDLACGQGRIARALARRGAQMVGIDISDVLLDKARAAEKDHPLGITYVHADVSASNALGGETFDGVVCNYGLSDIDHLDATVAAIAQVLRPGGWFGFSILHPCFPGWGDDAPSSWRPGAGYYREGWWLARSPGFRGKVGANHRMFSTYLNVLASNGFLVERALEPDPGPEWASRMPAADAVPVYLVARCRKL
ncbi:MAG: class I SAM-dependent methyltransferase [Actinomycetota bacterium]|nr:class I SAM-dependent methyltransferase [Actinomycetota bacterium]